MSVSKKVLSVGLTTVLAASMIPAVGVFAADEEIPTLDQIKVGEDYQNLTASIKVLTNRTDIVDTVYKGYAEEFMKMYPNIKVEYEGITELPTTPDEFLDDLQTIKDNTDSIPLYTNFAAGWQMGAWDAYIGVTATGDADYMNNTICYTKDPFAKQDDMTGPYAVYYTMYESVARGLVKR